MTRNSEARTVDVAVIGGGPAGMTAATEAAARGAKVVLLDEGIALGGKVLRAPKASGLAPRKKEASITRELHESFALQNVKVLTGFTVWGVDEKNTVAVNAKGADSRVKAKTVILCAGAIERVVPYPGWTLPGVFTVGGMNIMIKSGALCGKRVLVAGSGPLLLVLAENLIRSGANVVALLNATGGRTLMPGLRLLFSGLGLSRFLQGLGYLRTLAAAGVKIHKSRVVASVSRNSSGLSVGTSGVDKDWTPLRSTERRFEVDAVAVSYGLIPAIELAHQRGCRINYDEVRGHWRIVREGHCRTTQPGFYAAGDGVCVSGYEAAIIEGRIAAIEACAEAGFTSPQQAREAFRPLVRKLLPYKEFGFYLDRLSRPGKGLQQIMTDDTFVCRCEEVSLGNVRSAIIDGAVDINDLKRRTRLGMGHCQGRFCGQLVNELLWEISGVRGDRQHFTSRLPVKTVTFGELAE